MKYGDLSPISSTLENLVYTSHHNLFELITAMVYFVEFGVFISLHCPLQSNMFSSIVMFYLYEITCTVVFQLRVLRKVHYADLDFLFHMFFLARYCKLLEETSFRGRTADFFFMLLFGGTILTTIVVGGGLLTFAAPFADILFLSNSLTFMMVSSSTSYHSGFCCSL